MEDNLILLFEGQEKDWKRQVEKQSMELRVRRSFIKRFNEDNKMFNMFGGRTKWMKRKNENLQHK